MTTPPQPTPIQCEREDCGCRQDGDRVIWIAVRRGLLVIVKAIEARYDVSDDKKQRAA